MAFGEVYVPAIVGDINKTRTSILTDFEPLVDGKSLGTGDGDLYSSHTPGFAYTRNPDFWGAQYDISCISVWNDLTDTTRRVTLVTPLHAVGAKHYGDYAIGQLFGFVDMNNNYEARAVVDIGEMAGRDIIVLTFSSELPSTFKPCKILPSNWADKLDLSNTNEVIYPTLTTNQFNQGTVQTLYYYNEGNEWATFKLSAQESWPDMYRNPEIGDSGNPSMLMQNGEIMLVTLWDAPTVGPMYSSFIHEINSLIVEMSGSSYSVTEGVLTSYDIDVLGNPLTNLGGYVHNGAETNNQQDPDAWQLLNSIEVSFDGVPETLPLHHSAVNGKPQFPLPAGAVLFTGANWILAGAVTSSHPTANGQYPPKTGWPDTNTGKTLSIEYDMFGIEDDGTRTELSMADYLAFENGTQNTLLKWEKAGANNTCHLPQVIRYKQGTTDNWTGAEHGKAVIWAGDPTCGDGFIAYSKDLALAGGELIQLAGGEQIELS